MESHQKPRETPPKSALQLLRVSVQKISKVFSWHSNQLAEPSRFKRPQNSNNWVYFKIDGLFMIGLPTVASRIFEVFKVRKSGFWDHQALFEKWPGPNPARSMRNNDPEQVTSFTILLCLMLKTAARNRMCRHVKLQSREWFLDHNHSNQSNRLAPG